MQKLVTPAYSAYFIPAGTFQSSLPLPWAQPAEQLSSQGEKLWVIPYLTTLLQQMVPGLCFTLQGKQPSAIFGIALVGSLYVRINLPFPSQSVNSHCREAKQGSIPSWCLCSLGAGSLLPVLGWNSCLSLLHSGLSKASQDRRCGTLLFYGGNTVIGVGGKCHSCLPPPLLPWQLASVDYCLWLTCWCWQLYIVFCD